MSASWTYQAVGELIDGLSAGVSVRSISDATSGPAVLKTSSVHRGRFIPSESKTILPADIPRASCVVTAGSLIVSRMNTPSLVGDVGYVDEAYPNLYLPDRLWIARSKRGSGTDLRWLTYYFSSEPGARRLRGLATGTSGSMKNIPKNRILALAIRVPAPSEQRAISSALSAVDGFIASLRSAITKKQAIKQSMLQQLLTGRARLPGFMSRWESVNAGDVGYFSGGSGFPLRYQGASRGTYPYFKVSDMNTVGNDLFMTTANHYISAEQLNRIGATLIPEHAIVFAKVGAAIFLERKRMLAQPSCIDNNMVALIVDHGCADVRFLHYFLSHFPLASLVAAGALPSLNNRQLRSIPILLPAIDEQRAIARVLADVDEELSALGLRLEKARTIKTGMMQQLLTGRTRLPVGATS